MDKNTANHELSKYLSPLNVWALSIGCAVGWGAFVMPGNTFLPLAGPMGTAFGIAIGAFVMLIIGINYHYLMVKYPDAGGTLTYSIRSFGFDHGLLSAWFLMLVYIAIIWANATAIVLIVRNIFGSVLQFGFHYNVAGYDVYFGEVLLTLFVIIFFGFVCMLSKRLAVYLQTIMAFALVAGVIICTVAVIASKGSFSTLAPSFAPNERGHFPQILSIIILAPWAFSGFESISNSTQDFKFSPKKTIWIMLTSLTVAAFCYISLSFIAASVIPEGYSDWSEYMKDLDNLEGLKCLPVFNAVDTVMGKTGLIILSITITGGIITGLIGNYIAASRLIYAMTEDRILPEWFGVLKNHNPCNAYKFLILISLAVPFAGRAAIGWIIDINTIGALIAYAYTSASAFKAASDDGNRPIKFTGVAGTIISAIFLLYFMVPNIWTASSLSAESYLILIVWSVLGFGFFHYVLHNDRENHFGRTTVVWIALLFMIFFTSLLWLRQTNTDKTHQVLSELNQYNIDELEENGVYITNEISEEASEYLQKKMDEIYFEMIRSSWMQMAVIVIVLVIMFSIYKLISKREKAMELEKIKAEESNRAKSTFLSNMSHDIRTPMNAIIGYTAIARKNESLPAETVEYLEKIEASGKHLLALINDILDMSRIENGKMELEPENTDLFTIFKDLYDLFSTQMNSKEISYSVNTDRVKNRYVVCDANRLNRVLLNLVSNACKFTPKGGKVTVDLIEKENSSGKSLYEISVADTGIGMSPEFAATVFEAYSREKTASKIQGTGLGMSITKRIVDLMDGDISVKSEQGKGSKFTVLLKLAHAEAPVNETKEPEETVSEGLDLEGIKILLVDDNEINRDIAMISLEDEGFILDTAENGKEAYEKIASSAPGDFDAVLMDVQMPVMDGYEATRAIRSLSDKELSSIPILAMTANAFAEDVEAAKAAGMDGHLSKPIDIDRIKEELERVLVKKNG